ncbi:MAG: hypothetical protein ACTHJW_28445 [Streptosporangiaceae bacterium]
MSPRKAGWITAHLAACTICAEIDADLRSVSILLAETQLPPMPEAFAARIQLTIATEAAMRATGGAAAVVAPGVADVAGNDAGSVAGADVSDKAGVTEADTAAGGSPGSGVGRGTDESARIPGRPDVPPRRRRGSRRFRKPVWSSPLLLRGLAAAGAVAIIAGAGALFIRGHAIPSAGSNSGSAGGQRGAPAAGPARPSAHGTASGTQFSGENGTVSLSYHRKGKIATARALSSDHNYTKQNMVPLVHKDIASATDIGKPAGPATRPQPSSLRGTLGGIRVLTLIGCLTRLAAGRSILVADVARYLGQPATIVVMKPAANARVLKVAVVRVTCSLASPEIIAQVTIPAG